MSTEAPTPCPFYDDDYTGHSGPVLTRRLNTRYVHEESNWLTSCRACFEETWAEYDSQWADSNQPSPFSSVAPSDATVARTAIAEAEGKK